MITYPNQKIIHINKKKYTANFLQVGVNEWQKAFQELKPSTFGIYLYLASNADGYDLALSQKAVENALGIKKSSYHNAIAELESKGYISLIQGNIQSFFTTPVQKNGLHENGVQKNELPVQKFGQDIPKNWTEESKKMNFEVQKIGREIDNINNINKINNIDKEIQMYKALDSHISSNGECADEIEELLETACYWNVPEEKINLMTAAELQQLETYYNKYCC